MLLFGSFTSSETLSIEKETENCGCEKTTNIETFLAENPPKDESIYQQKELTESDIKVIADKLCAIVKFASSSEFSSEKFKNVIYTQLKVSSSLSEKEKNLIVSNFLNKYKQKLICPESKDDAFDRDLHLFKTALFEGVIELYDDILLDDELFNIDLNAYQIVDGKKETVLDFIEKLLTTKFKGDTSYELLRDDIIEFGGKRGKELKDWINYS